MKSARPRAARALFAAMLLASTAHGVFAQTRGRPATTPSNRRATAVPSRRVVLDSGAEYMCRIRGPAVARALPADLSDTQRRGETLPAVFVSRDTLALRDANQQIVIRELPSTRQIAALSGTGGILYADASRVVLWRREPQSAYRRYTQRTVVSIDVATGHETVSPPMPLPDWLLATNDPESAETVRATIDGADVVVNWSAATSWMGGIAPSEEQARAAHHEDCGSLRITPSGTVTEGSYIVTHGAARTPPASLGASRGTPVYYAGDGVYWVETRTASPGARSYALADESHPPVPVTLGAVPAGSIPVTAGVWMAGTRAVVLRAFQSTESYAMPRDVSVVDRATGAVSWSTPVATLQVLPPRP